MAFQILPMLKKSPAIKARTGHGLRALFGFLPWAGVLPMILWLGLGGCRVGWRSGCAGGERGGTSKTGILEGQAFQGRLGVET